MSWLKAAAKRANPFPQEAAKAKVAAAAAAAAEAAAAAANAVAAAAAATSTAPHLNEMSTEGSGTGLRSGGPASSTSTPYGNNTPYGSSTPYGLTPATSFRGKDGPAGQLVGVAEEALPYMYGTVGSGPTNWAAATAAAAAASPGRHLSPAGSGGLVPTAASSPSPDQPTHGPAAAGTGSTAVSAVPSTVRQSVARGSPLAYQSTPPPPLSALPDSLRSSQERSPHQTQSHSHSHPHSQPRVSPFGTGSSARHARHPSTDSTLTSSYRSGMASRHHSHHLHTHSGRHLHANPHHHPYGLGDTPAPPQPGPLGLVGSSVARADRAGSGNLTTEPTFTPGDGEQLDLSELDATVGRLPRTLLGGGGVDTGEHGEHDAGAGGEGYYGGGGDGDGGDEPHSVSGGLRLRKPYGTGGQLDGLAEEEGESHGATPSGGAGTDGEEGADRGRPYVGEEYSGVVAAASGEAAASPPLAVPQGRRRGFFRRRSAGGGGEPPPPSSDTTPTPSVLTAAAPPSVDGDAGRTLSGGGGGGKHRRAISAILDTWRDKLGGKSGVAAATAAGEQFPGQEAVGSWGRRHRWRRSKAGTSPTVSAAAREAGQVSGDIWSCFCSVSSLCADVLHAYTRRKNPGAKSCLCWAWWRARQSVPCLAVQGTLCLCAQAAVSVAGKSATKSHANVVPQPSTRVSSTPCPW